MRVLLVGEYNKAQLNIKKGLELLGHEAIVVGTTDGFKKVDVDIDLKDYFNSFLIRKFRILLYKLFKIDLFAISIKKQIKAKRKQLSNYDIVQLVNEAPFSFDRKSHHQIFNWLKEWNNCPFYLLSCGLDYPSVSYAFDKKFRYSILTPYFENKGSKKDFSPALSYLTSHHLKLHTHIFNKIEGVIANDLDYHIPLIDHPKYLGMIPHAIDLSKLIYKAPKIEDKIIIFHGINTYNYYKKGNDIFEDALAIISQKHSDKVEIIVVKNLPYKDYIKSFDKAHILLDQVYAYDQGFNALEAMAKGKVVFTGAEQEWEDYYNVEKDTIVINALLDAEAIALKLEWLIENPEKLIDISKKAREFVETHHDHINCAKQYLKKWSYTK
ncbi:glycosyltransferase [uncultured Winogradskyella sp.]|uniref:glycosyltransferase n=1 Tax=uncultured Winogradskyella sp. TaxID=395353 RepID=UPI0030DBCC8F|tara:strand:+ start:9193 stop:10338 length:1146 start_codon:yes stop_codon:yes gene_type:complete